MKKILCVVLAIVMFALCLSACGGGGSKSNVVGIWEVVADDGDTGEYSFASGFGWEFEKNGDINWVVKGEDGKWISNDDTEALKYLYSMTYKIDGDTIKITQKLLGGLGGKETTEGTFEIDGDVMYIDGTKFQRVN